MTEFWERADVVGALRVRDWGTVFRTWRHAHSATQAQLSRRIGLPQSHISEIERGRRRVTQLGTVEEIARGLRIPWSALSPADQGVTSPDTGAQDGPVQRREFLGVAAGMAVLPPLLAGRTAGRVSLADVAGWRDQLDQLVQLEGRLGGSAVFDTNVAIVGRLRQLREQGSATVAAARELDRLIAKSCFEAGWAAYDGDRHEVARAWWMEGLHAADLAGDEEVPAQIYATLSMQAFDQGRGREAAALAQRAQKSAAALPVSPRLRSLLHAREAKGHALAGNPTLAWRTYAKLDHPASSTPRDDDGPWLAFWGPADLAAGRAGSARSVGDLGAYEAGARDAVAAVDADRYPRNHMSYSSMLGDALVRRGTLDEAVPVLAGALAQSTTIGSARIRRRLGGTLDRLRPYREHRPVGELLDWAAQLRPAVST